MADRRTPIRVFLSSPGDVAHERTRAALVISRLAREFSRFFKISPVLWEYEPMLAAGTFQDVITPPSSTDIVVVVLWSRLGTRLPPPYASPIDGRSPVTGTEWEFEDAIAHQRVHGTPDVLVYRNDAVPYVPGKLETLDASAQQLKAVEAFWSRYFISADGRFLLANTRYETLDGFSDQLERDLRSLLRRRLHSSALASGEVAWHAGSPYRGLRAFDVAHAAIFFGRSLAQRQVTEALVRRAARAGEPAFCLILGASGSGKSSLARAGVLVDLMAAGVVDTVEVWRHCIFRPGQGGGDPVVGLAHALYDDAVALPELAELRFTAADLARSFEHADETATLPLRNALALIGERFAKGAARPPAAVRLALVIDQMEELFTGACPDAGRREAFVRLLDVLARSGFVYILATMRSEFYPGLATLPVLRGLAAGEGQYLLTTPVPAELDEMIRLPAEAADVYFERDEHGIGLDARLRDAAAGERDGLPLLEFALDQMFRADIVEAQGRVLTFETYRKIGQLKGAVAEHADAVLEGLPDEVRAWFPDVLQQLVSIDLATQTVVSRQARRQDLVDEGSPGAAERAALIDALASEEARLLVTDRDAGSGVVRLAHEALIAPGNWERAELVLKQLSQFLRDRARVQLAASVWESAGRSPDRLLTGARPLAEANDLRSHRLAPELRAFIEASLEAEAARIRLREAEARRAATLRMRVAVAVIAVLALFAGWAGYEWRVATDAANAEATARTAAQTSQHQAEAAAEKEADARKLADDSAAKARASEAAAQARRDWALSNQSLYLARVAEQERIKGAVRSAVPIALAGAPEQFAAPDRPVVPELMSVLARAVAQDQTRMAFKPPGDGAILSQMSPSGAQVLSLDMPGGGTLWEAATGRRIARLQQGAASRFRSPVYAPDGSWFLLPQGDGGIVRFASNAPTTPLSRYSGIAETGVRPAGLAISGDGHWAAASRMMTAQQSEIHIWDTTTGVQRVVFLTDMGFTEFFKLNRDGSRLLVSGPADELLLYDVEARRWIGELPGHFEPHAFAFAPDGESFAAGNEAGDILLHDAKEGAPIGKTHAHDQKVTALIFPANGEAIISGSADRTVRVWPADLQGGARKVFPEHQSAIVAVAASADGRIIASADEGSAYVWGEAVQTQSFSMSPLRIRALSLSEDGSRLFLEDELKAFRVFDVPAPQPLQRFAGAEAKLNLLARSEDGTKIAASGWRDDGRLWLWDAATGRQIAKWRGHAAEINSLSFLPDGHLMSASNDRTVAVWNADDASEVFRLPRQEGRTYATGVAGRIVTWAEEDGLWSAPSPGWTAPIRVWDARTGTPVQSFAGHRAEPTAAILLAGGTQVLSADRSGQILLWDVPHGTVIRHWTLDIPGPPARHGTAYSLEALTDGMSVLIGGSEMLAMLNSDAELPRFVASQQSGRFARLQIDESRGLGVAADSEIVAAWRLDDGARAWWYRLGQKDGTATGWTTGAVAVDRDRGVAVVGTSLGHLLFLDTSTGQLVGTLTAHAGDVTAVTIDSNHTVISAGADGLVLRHRLPSLQRQDLLDYARATRTENLDSRLRDNFGIVGSPDVPPAAAAAVPDDAAAGCDRQARPLSELEGGAPAVAWDDLDIAAAETACRAALAATPGVARLQMELARTLLKKGHADEAMALFHQASDAGSAAATAYLGERLQAGSGIAKDPAGGLQLLLRAAEAGNRQAMDDLGVTYRDGVGVQPDAEVARRWWEKAAALGFPFAMGNLADLLSDPAYPRRDTALALYWRLREADLFDLLPGFYDATVAARQASGNAALQEPEGTVIAAYRRARQDGKLPSPR